MRNVITALVATAAVLGVATTASAANPATATFTVSATVLKTCTVGATNLTFPNYTPGGGALAAASTVTVTCTNGTAYTVALNAGTTPLGTVAARLMAEQGGGTGTMQYNLCTAPATAAGACSAGTAWGDTTLGTVTQAGTGTGMAAGSGKAFTVNGGLPDNAVNQNAPLNGNTTTYQDTVTVSVAY